MSKLILNHINLLENNKKNNFWNITYKQGFFLSKFIEIKDPDKILEIGTSNGYSTLWLAKNSNSNCKIDTIEINQEKINIAKNNFNKCNLNNINLIKGDLFEIINNIQNKYDIIFVDTRQEKYKEILNIIKEKKILNKNGYLIFDNINDHQSTKNFTKQIDPEYKTIKIDIGSGFLICYSKNLS